MNQSVFAVVVTFNRANILRLCLDNLLKQIDHGLERIHVVVNSNDEATKLLLEAYSPRDLITFEFLDNPGPAGGFNAGLRLFMAEKHSHVWLMDDDVIVSADCLKELLRCTLNEEYIYPIVLTEDGKELGAYGWWGLILSRRVVKKVGLPMTELFYWAEDTEYLQHRIKRVNKISPFKCKSAFVKHLHIRNEKRPSWYYYYVLRNSFFYRRYILKFNLHHLNRLLYLIYTSIVRIVLKEDCKSKKIRLMGLGIYHGVIGKIGKLVDPGLNR